MRPHIDLGDEDRKRVEQYAEDNGLRMERAYAELIVKGLDETEVDA